MSSSWRGLYLKADRKDAASALLRLAHSRGYSLLRYEHTLDEPTLVNVWQAGMEGRLESIEVILMLSVDDVWTRVIGLDFDAMALPRLFYTYELVMLLGCDAFEAGFADKDFWWYSYYEKGLIVDRFCSAPLKAISALTDAIWGPDDPRVIYSRCLLLDRIHDLRSLPTPIQQQFRGDPSKLRPVLKPLQEQKLRLLLQETHPEQAISTLAQVVNLRYIGEYSTMVFFEDFADERLRGEPTPDWITEPLKQGLALTILSHPKSALIAS